MSTYADTDVCTDIILDFIAGGHWGDTYGNPIGETDGNYNAYFGCVDSTVNLCAMTLSEIYQFQSEMLEDDPRSTAIGRYQFLRSTLQSLQQQNGLANSTIFTARLQDELSVDLLVQRGYSDWWLNIMSDQQFASNLSKEWASLPDPYNGGKSHYDGDSAGNHASTSLDCVYNMLRQAKSRISSDTPEPQVAEIKLLPPTTAIKLIQALLRRRSLLDNVDGIWGPQSQQALDTLASQAKNQP